MNPDFTVWWSGSENDWRQMRNDLNAVMQLNFRIMANGHLCIQVVFLWPKLVKPVRWLNDEDFYGSLDDYLDAALTSVAASVIHGRKIRELREITIDLRAARSCGRPLVTSAP